MSYCVNSHKHFWSGLHRVAETGVSESKALYWQYKRRRTKCQHLVYTSSGAADSQTPFRNHEACHL